MSFLNDFNVLTTSQYGFQANKSTELAVNAIINRIIKSFEDKESAYTIFLDFAEAFDTVAHTILLSKLQYYGIRGTPLNLFQSYLTNRKQYTQIENILSDY